MGERWAVPAGEIDLAAGVLRTSVGPVPLTSRECHLLRYLRAQEGRVVSREELLERVWGYAPGARSRAIDTAVQRLRAKIQPDPAGPQVLQTVRGEGYRFGAPVGASARAAVASGAFPRLDRVVGRAAEQREASALLHAGHRVVVLTGPPGVGKTWLARRVGTTILDEGRVHVWFADLHGATGPDAVADAVARALELSRPLGDALALTDALAARGRSVGILDDAQALDDAAVALVGEWVRRVPSLALLATSQRPLRLEGERRLAIEPLDEAAAVELVRDRLAALAVPPPPTEVLARIARRLDGLPLAIELAAPLLEVLSPEAWLEGPATWPEARPQAVDRHRSLDAAVGDAVAMVPEEARRLLLALSVFAGPFDPPRAAEVLGAGDVGALALLRRRSLLRRLEDGRLGLYGAVRDWARARLDGGERARLAEAHARWVLATPAAGRAELVQAVTDGPASLRDRLAATLVRQVRSDGPLDLARPVLERALASTGAPEVRAGLLCRLAEVLRLAGRAEAAETRAREAHTLAAGDRALAARALAELAQARNAQGWPAPETAREAVALAVRVGDPEVEYAARVALADALAAAHDPEAHAAWEDAGRLGVALGRPEEAIGAVREAGHAHSQRGRFAEALACYERALAMAGDGHPRLAAVLRAGCGTALTLLGDLDRAAAAWDEATRGLAAVGDPVLRSRFEVRRAILDAAQGERARALRRLRRVRRDPVLLPSDDVRAAIFLALLTGDVREMPRLRSGPLWDAATAVLAGAALPPGTPASDLAAITILTRRTTAGR